MIKAAVLLIVLFTTGSVNASITAVLRKNGYSKFVELLVMTGTDRYVNSLSVKNATLFVPQDAAFIDWSMKLNPTFPDRPLASKILLQQVLRYHIIPGARLPASALTDGNLMKTLQGARIKSVLVKSSNPGRAGTYLDGGTNRAKITWPDMFTSTWAFHEVDSVLMPSFPFPGCMTPLSLINNTGAYLFHQTLLRTSHWRLFALDSFAGTFFVPSNDVFVEPLRRMNTAITNQTAVEEYITKNLPTFEAIMLNHVIRGRVYASQMVDGQKFVALSGKTITIKQKPRKRYPDNRDDFVVQGPRSQALIRLADNYACRAVVHVIDRWLSG